MEPKASKTPKEIEGTEDEEETKDPRETDFEKHGLYSPLLVARTTAEVSIVSARVSEDRLLSDEESRGGGGGGGA